jgi:hypothetical protein
MHPNFMHPSRLWPGRAFGPIRAIGADANRQSKDTLSLKHLSCEAPIGGHLANHDAASMCGRGVPLAAFTLNPVWWTEPASTRSGALAFVIECRAEKGLTELRSCS